MQQNGRRRRNGHSVASRTWCVDRHGLGQCLGAVELEARENPSGLAATKYRAASEAGYTSAVVTIEPDPVDLLQSGGVHIRPHMAQSGRATTTNQCPFLGGKAHRADVLGCPLTTLSGPCRCAQAQQRAALDRPSHRNQFPEFLSILHAMDSDFHLVRSSTP